MDTESFFLFLFIITLYFVSVVTQGGGLGGGSVMPEDQSRKREMRLLKNR